MSIYSEFHVKFNSNSPMNRNDPQQVEIFGPASLEKDVNKRIAEFSSVFAQSAFCGIACAESYLKGEPSFMPHEADRGLVHHLVEDHQVLVLELVLCLAGLEVVVKVVLKLGLLLPDVREIDEEPGHRRYDHHRNSLRFVSSQPTVSLNQAKRCLIMFLKCCRSNA